MDKMKLDKVKVAALSAAASALAIFCLLEITHENPLYLHKKAVTPLIFRMISVSKAAKTYHKQFGYYPATLDQGFWSLILSEAKTLPTQLPNNREWLASGNSTDKSGALQIADGIRPGQTLYCSLAQQKDRPSAFYVLGKDENNKVLHGLNDEYVLHSGQE